MKLVEVIAGAETDQAVIDAAVALMRAWGKHPVLVRDVAGFIVNRVARPYYAEGFIALEEGIEAALIDEALTASGGFPMGPLALADMIGHDVNYAVASSVHDAGFGRLRFRPQDAQRALVDADRLGRKSGRGVYDYSAPRYPIAFVNGHRPTAEVRMSDAGLLQPLVDAARAVGIAIVSDGALDRETLDIDSVRVALGDGRRLAERPNVSVLLDHARDFATATTAVITARSPSDAKTVAGFFKMLDKKTVSVCDRPGQLVLRTLAQLANAAADTVADRIASARDVETAMLHGANHPEGPFSWARRAGNDRVRKVLGHIERGTKDALYAPSPLSGRD